MRRRDRQSDKEQTERRPPPDKVLKTTRAGHGHSVPGVGRVAAMRALLKPLYSISHRFGREGMSGQRFPCPLPRPKVRVFIEVARRATLTSVNTRSPLS